MSKFILFVIFGTFILLLLLNLLGFDHWFVNP